MPRSLLLVALLLLAGCAALREGREGREARDRAAPREVATEARMAQAPSVAGVAEEPLGRLPWGRQGELTLDGQRVRYTRGAERLSLFEPLPAGVREPLRFQAGETVIVCEGWTPSSAAGLAPPSWVLSCQWGRGPAAMLQIGEGPLRQGQRVREGAYRRGDLTVGLRSAHQREGGAPPQPQAVGYEMLHQGTVVGSLDLSGVTPRLRRPDPATPLGRAVTEAAWALLLVSER
ncbi:hypothetical protein [Roseateles sp. LKC17W]|uniref:Uncharacterized protein n=1 Tax=Pelomonas margarita TaxID=3299031 RepID=A0ABW7FN48_9BURK